MCPFAVLFADLFTNDCVSHHFSVKCVQFAEDTTLEGLVANSDKSEYRHDVNMLVSWCDNNNLQLNASKNREIIVDYRKTKTPIAPIIINVEIIERMDCFKCLGTIIPGDLGWENNIDAVVKRPNKGCTSCAN